jgi:AbrB family looped-hinge helix DNA binding protein
MAKVTGKFQITLPRTVADACGIRVGDELEVRRTGRTVQLIAMSRAGLERQERLGYFDRATARQRARSTLPRARSRGWTREELYTRGRPR